MASSDGDDCWVSNTDSDVAEQGNHSLDLSTHAASLGDGGILLVCLTSVQEQPHHHCLICGWAWCVPHAKSTVCYALCLNSCCCGPAGRRDPSPLFCWARLADGTRSMG
jgi:hypothetical protein